METCGSISVSEDYKNFLLQCLYCTTEISITNWVEFVQHIQQDHSCAQYDGDEAISEHGVTEPLSNLDFCENEINCNQVNICKKREPPDFSDCLDVGLVDYLVKAESNPTSTAQTQESTDAEGIEGIIEESMPESEDEDLEFAKYQPRYQFTPSFYRRNPRTLHFIEFYKAQPCLWNPQDPNYKNEVVRAVAYQTLLRDLHDKLNITIKENALKTAIKQLHTLFIKVTKLQKDESHTINSAMLRHYKKCEFLQKAARLDEMEEVKPGPLQLTFTEINDFATKFIDLYSKFPELYDTNHQDYTNVIVRNQAYKTILQELLMINIDCTDDDVYRGIQYLRQWYNRTARHLRSPHVIGLKKAEIFYFDKCSYLPIGQQRERLSCLLCSQKFFSDLKLQAHMYKIHEIGELPYVCGFCNRRFDNRADMNVHTLRAHSVKKHKCKYCDKFFAVPTDCTLHERTHTGEKPYICDQCGKAFRSGFQLNYHITAIHTKIREYECDQCPKAFFKKRQLVDHIKGHLNIRDKKCETCGKGFTNCHSLVRHRKIHKAEPKHRTTKRNLS